MKDLIAIETNSINGELTQTVNARDLHAFLGVGRFFANWIKDRIVQYDFIENQDFIIPAKSGKYSDRGQPKKEYAISIDMAKELSMVERNEKGKEARQYFIQCEKKLKDTNKYPKLPQTYVEALKELLKSKENEETLIAAVNEQAEALQEAQSIIEEAKPKVAFVDSYVDADGLLAFRQVSKLLEVKEGTLRSFLTKKGYMYRLYHGWMFNHYFQKRGYGVIKTFITELGNAKTSIKFTPKGVEMLHRRMLKD